MGARKDRKKEQRQKQQLKAQQRAIIEKLKPLLWAFILWFALLALVHLPFLKEPFREFFVRFTNYSAYWFGKILFLPVEMSRVPFLTVNGFTMRVVMECTAYTFYFLGAAIVIFTRWPLRHKFKSLAVFILSVFILNNLRFISMGYLGSFYPDLFQPVHDILWNVLFGFMILGFWVWGEASARKQGGVSVEG